MTRNILLYLLFLGLLSCSGNVNNHDATIQLKEMNDQDIDLAQYKGKVVFINFWATWCKPCIQEMPTIESAKNVLKGKGIVFLFASNERKADIEKFASKHSYDFHYVRSQNLDELDIQALPTTYILNPEGKLVFSEPGFRKWDDPSNIELITRTMNDHEKL